MPAPEPAPLSPTEKTAGRAFRDAQICALADLNTADPPEYYPPNFLKVYRHPCPSRGARSTALQLKEVYVHSPDGRFGWIYKQGRCPACGQRARSRAGKLVDAYARPPAEGRVARGDV